MLLKAVRPDQKGGILQTYFPLFKDNSIVIFLVATLPTFMPSVILPSRTLLSAVCQVLC
jgi:hypothetical protein